MKAHSVIILWRFSIYIYLLWNDLILIVVCSHWMEKWSGFCIACDEACNSTLIKLWFLEKSSIGIKSKGPCIISQSIFILGVYALANALPKIQHQTLSKIIKAISGYQRGEFWCSMRGNSYLKRNNWQTYFAYHTQWFWLPQTNYLRRNNQQSQPWCARPPMTTVYCLKPPVTMALPQFDQA